jgi:hypothetical protein
MNDLLLESVTGFAKKRPKNETCHQTCHRFLRGEKGIRDRCDRCDRFPQLYAHSDLISPKNTLKSISGRGTSKNLSHLSPVTFPFASSGYPMKPKIKPMPKWMAERIADNITRDGELARPGVCNKCKSGVWVASIPYPAKLDPEPLDARGELDALLVGLHTWTAKPMLLTFWPQFRLAETIAKTKPTEIVLADHRCRELIVIDMPDYWPERRPARPNLSNGEFPF